jgi:uncharacterized damage-inducible protein DinB
MISKYFAMLARYNAWANCRLYEACEALPAREYMRPRASFFGSLHATLNHILVVDRIWVARIESQTPASLKLDQILYGDLIGLKVARLAEDEHIRNMLAGIAEGKLDRPVEYRNSRGDRCEMPLCSVLAHFFNHQTHHRGQVHDMLSHTGASPPSLDLIDFARLEPAETTVEASG